MDTYGRVRQRIRSLPPWIPDGVLALAVSILPLVILSSLPEGTPGLEDVALGPLTVVLTFLSGLPLVWRRRRPGIVLVVIGLAMVAAAVLGEPAQGFGLIVALYTYAARSERDHGARILVGVGLFVLVTLVLADAVGYAGLNLVIFLTAWVLGDRQRTHRLRTADLERRAEALERERDVGARLAVVGERSRITRELHDVVAHGVTAMITQATAAERMIAADPQRAAFALEQVEETGRASLVELRRMLGLLRDGDGELQAPQPTLDDVEALVDAFIDVGLPVRLQRSGDLGSVAAVIQIAVHRLVQEALTNALSHAGTTRVDVDLRCEDGWITVEIADDGTGSQGHPAGGGRDRVPSSERVRLLGGVVTTGHREGGYTLVARLPVEACP